MKIAIAQLNYHIGNFAENTKKIINAIQKAKQQKADLIVFAELAICGYPPRDFLEFEDFISLCDNAIYEIAKETKEIAVIIGSVFKNPNKEGKRLYNAAYFIYQGKVQAIAKKSLLPTYDVFDEYRYFETAKDFSVIQYKNKKIALTICEDLWDIEERERLYTIRPMDELIKQKPDFMVNIAASPFHSKQEKKRKEILQQNCIHYQLPLL